MHLDVPKQFIAEEKPLGNGRNTYIISEVDPNKQNSLNSLGNMDFGKNENVSSFPEAGFDSLDMPTIDSELKSPRCF